MSPAPGAGPAALVAPADPLVRPGAEQAPLNVLLLAPHRPKLDPRLSWMARHAPEPLLVHQVGALERGDFPGSEEADATDALTIAVPLQDYVPGEALRWSSTSRSEAGRVAALQLLWLERVCALAPGEFMQAMGATIPTFRVEAFRQLLLYVLDITATLVRHCSEFENVHAVIAADLPALPAALLLGSRFGVPVAFDAHEYWPEADLAAEAFETAVWRQLEADLLRFTHVRATVSTGLAELMSNQYGLPVLCVPNAEPLASADRPQVPPATGSEGCTFLFQGRFAQGRGLELLIRAWQRAAPGARLLLRGPASPYRDELMALSAAGGTFGRSVFFPEAVGEDEMVAVAALADVGVVPYEPRGAIHQHCCPNKLSQYMAAGLPILANTTCFVRDVLLASGGGTLVDFSQEDALVAAVELLTRDSELRRRHAAANAHYFRTTFHWEAVSRDFYRVLLEVLGSAQGGELARRDNAGLVEAPTGRWKLLAPTLYERSLGLHPQVLSRAWFSLPSPIRFFVRPAARGIRRLLRRSGASRC